MKAGEVSRVVKHAAAAKKKGDYHKAEQLYRQGLASCRTMMGDDNLEAVKWLNLLGQVQKQQGKWEDAVDTFRDALSVREKALGAEHELVARTLNNLAILLEKTEKYDEAEEMYRRCLKISLKEHEEEHADTATALNNLAGVLEKTSRFAEAEELYIRALVIMEKTNGAEHGDTATLLHNIAVVLKMQGRVADAAGYHRRALNIRESNLAPDSPVLAKSQSSLALALSMMGQREEAEILFRSALSIEEAYADQNPSGALAWRSLGNTAAALADCLMATDRPMEAITRYAQAAECRESYLGLDHPQVAATRQLQARAQRQNGDLEDAIELLGHLRAGCEAAGQSDKYNKAEVDVELAECMLAMNDHAKAEKILTKLFEELSDDPNVPKLLAAKIRCALGNALLAGHPAAKALEAEALGRMAMELVKQSPGGKESADMAAPLRLIAAALQQQGGRELEYSQLYREADTIETNNAARISSDGSPLLAAAAQAAKDSKEVEALEVDEFQDGPETARHAGALTVPEPILVGGQQSLSPQLTQRDVSLVIREDAEGEREAAQDAEEEDGRKETALRSGSSEGSGRQRGSGRKLVVAMGAETALKLQSDGNASLEQVAVEVIEKQTGKTMEELKANAKGTLGLAASLDQSACVLSAESKLDEAIPLYRMSLEIRQNSLGEQHLVVATSLNNLAISLKRKGQYQEAEEAYSRSLAIREGLLGEDHVSVAQSLHNLAALKDAMGDHEEAEQLYRRAIDIRETKLGSHSAKLASSLGNLGGLLENLGRYNEAEELYRRVLGINEHLHQDDPHHPEMGAAQTRLALLLKLRAKLGEAEALLRTALASAARRASADPRHVAAATMNLASVRRAAEDFGEAEDLCRSALRMLESALGPVHQDVAAAQNNLADLLQCQGKLEQAEALYKAAIEGLEAVLGACHPALNTPISNLADLLAEKGDEQESRRWYKRAIEVTRSSTATSTSLSPQIATSANNQGVLQHDKGKMSAEPTLRRALEVREKALGPNHPDVADSLFALGTVLLEKGKVAEALPMLSRAVEVREVALGPTHPDVGSAMVALGDALQQNGDFVEAEQFYRQGVDIRKVPASRNAPSPWLCTPAFA